jgi:hypothetical protein
MLREWQEHFAEDLRALPGDGEPHLAALIGVQQHRFAIYRDNFVGSLVDALADTFPVTRQLVGERFFAMIAADFARKQPPSAARLSRYGGDFPAYLRGQDSLRDLAYVPDVAELEWARVESFFAGMPEATLTPETLLALPEETIAEVTFEPVASLKVVVTATASFSIWHEHQQTAPQLDSLDPWRGEAIRVMCNSSQGVSTVLITPAHAAFLRTLQEGADLATGYAAASAVQADFDLQGALVSELAAGSFAGVRTR